MDGVESLPVIGVDKYGLPYSKYPKCPIEGCASRVGRSAFGDGEWYCYECCTTFSA